jgi:hypothetical protein
MTHQSSRIFALMGTDLEDLVTAILEGYDLEYFVSFEPARQVLAARRFDLVTISNVGFRPSDAVELIPDDHAYPVLFYSGFMDEELAAICQAKRIRWYAIPFDPATLLADVANALSTPASMQRMDG